MITVEEARELVKNYSAFHITETEEKIRCAAEKGKTHINIGMNTNEVEYFQECGFEVYYDNLNYNYVISWKEKQVE